MSVRLDLPSAAQQTLYTFATLDWNHHGHAPQKVYDTPHFDAHFYMIPATDVHRIAGGPDPVVISSAFVPPGHISPGNRSVSAMGVTLGGRHTKAGRRANRGEMLPALTAGAIDGKRYDADLRARQRTTLY